jgi:hypothetical protein
VRARRLQRPLSGSPGTMRLSPFSLDFKYEPNSYLIWKFAGSKEMLVITLSAVISQS